MSLRCTTTLCLSILFFYGIHKPLWPIFLVFFPLEIIVKCPFFRVFTTAWDRRKLHFIRHYYFLLSLLSDVPKVFILSPGGSRVVLLFVVECNRVVTIVAVTSCEYDSRLSVDWSYNTYSTSLFLCSVTLLCVSTCSIILIRISI